MLLLFYFIVSNYASVPLPLNIPVSMGMPLPRGVIAFWFTMPSHLGLSPTWNLENPVNISIPLRWDYISAYVTWNHTIDGLVKFYPVVQKGNGYLTLPIGWYGPEFMFAVAFQQKDTK